MDTKGADAQLRHYAESLATLKAARKSIEGGPTAGIDGLDLAIAGHEAGAFAFVEEIARANWWRPEEISALAALIPLAVTLVGVNDSVVRLAVQIGQLSQPRAPFEDAA